MLLRLALCAALVLGAGPARAVETLPGAALPKLDASWPATPIPRRNLLLAGDPARPVKLDVVLLTPPGSGPFPLVIWNHGTAEAAARREVRDQVNIFAIYYFLSRGYAVAAPLMRGYGLSGGTEAACSSVVCSAGNVADILAVLDGLAREPALDARRVIVAGASFGGFNALATGARGDPRIRAVVNFHGGLRGDRPGWESQLVEAVRAFGARSRVPSLWIYGDNDRYFPAATWRTMRAAYAAGGAPTDVVAYGRFRDDSHQLLAFSESLPLFAPRLDAFLAGRGLQTAVIRPEYLPLAPPPASGYAPIGDVEAVPHVGASGRNTYRTFLSRPYPRAFVIVPGRRVEESYGGFDPLARALQRCRAAGETCKVYAVNGDVVWTRPAPVPPPSGFAVIDNVGAVPFLDEAGRTGYRQFLGLNRPRAFVVAPDGAWAFSDTGEDPLSTLLAGCRARQRTCRPYAVDGDVVWTGPKPGAPFQ